MSAGAASKLMKMGVRNIITVYGGLYDMDRAGFTRKKGGQ